MSKINLKICGITNKASILRAYENKVKSLGFASNNLNGPNTTNDTNIKTNNILYSNTNSSIYLFNNRIIDNSNYLKYDTNKNDEKFYLMQNSYEKFKY